MNAAAARGLVCVALAGFALVTPAAAQVRVSGGLNAYGELYERTGDPAPGGVSARPNGTGRISANLTLDFLNGLFTVPLTALLATDGVQFRQQINQLGISPTYRGMTLHLGHFTPDYSRYTLADATLLGGGFGWRRPGFRLGAVAGRARRAVRPDTVTVPGGDPQFERFAYGAQLGVGSREGSFFDLFLMQAEDDKTSLDTAITNNEPVSPQQNQVIGFKGRLALAQRRLTIDGEGATSRFDPNVAAAGDKATGQAASLKLLYNAPLWSLGGTLEWLAPGFTTLGNSGLVGDRVEYGLTGRATLAGGRLSVTTLGGWREDNLSDDLEATTSQAIYNLGVSWQPVAFFGLDLQAGNNVNDSRAKDDTSSIKNVTGQYSATPRFLWRTGAARHVLVLFGSHQRSDNTTPGSVLLVDTRTTTLVGTWTVAFPSSLTFSLAATRTGVEVDTVQTAVVTFTPGVSYTLLRGRLQAAAQAQFTAVMTDADDDRETYPLVQLRYTIARGQTVQLRSSVRHHESGAGGAFDERVLTLQYSAAWQ